MRLGGLWATIRDDLRRMRLLLYRRLYISSKNEKDITTRFHRMFFDSHIFDSSWGMTSWLGVKTLKCPLDLWIYQEIIHEVRPDLIIECGTAHGGSALYLATICDAVGSGRVITIDIGSRPGPKPAHKRIEYLTGSTTSEEIVKQVERRIKPGEKVMALLDSDHRMDHVLNEMRIYGRLVTTGSYLIVEDTDYNGHPVYPEYGPGPMEAVEAYMRENDDFTIDKSRERYYLTFNPNGYLRKVR